MGKDKAVRTDEGPRPRNGQRREAPVPLRKLAEAGWLSMQPEAFQQRIFALGRWVSIPRGQLLFSAGDDPDALFGLEDGLLDIAIPILDGEECTVYRATPGFWIGDGALIPGAPRTLTVAAPADCRLFRVPFSALRNNLSENPGDWEYLHRLSTLNATLAVRILSEVLSLPPTTRVARALLRLSTQDGRVESTQEDIGRLAGMSRATFRRSLARLIESGAIQLKYSGLTIVDRSAVEREANASET